MYNCNYIKFIIEYNSFLIDTSKSSKLHQPPDHQEIKGISF